MSRTDTALQPVTTDPVWLHPGMAKTATSTLQQHVFAHHSQIHFLGLPAPYPELEWAIRHVCQADSTRFEPERLRATFVQGLTTGSPERRPLISYENYALHESKDKGLVADRLAELFPNARILFTIRRQEDLVTSWYFTKLRLRLKRKAFIPFEEWYWVEAREPWNSILDDLCFHQTIRSYETHFGAANVAVLAFEELVREPSRFFRAAAAFLQIDAEEMAALAVGKRENAAMSARHLQFWRYVSPFLPRKLVRKMSMRLTFRSAAKARIVVPEAIKADIFSRVAADNAALAASRGLDLAGWGYSLPPTA